MIISIKTDIEKIIKEIKVSEEKYTTGFDKTVNKLKRGIDKLYRLQFVEGKNPYGEDWVRGWKSIGGPFGPAQTGRTMEKTGLLRNSLQQEFSSDTLTIGVGGEAARYAGAHHAGMTITAKNAKALRFLAPNGSVIYRKSVKLPQRLLVPTVERGLPTSWDILIERVFNE